MKSKKDIMEYFTEFENKEFAEKLCNATFEIADKCIEPTYLDTYETRFPKFDYMAEADYDEFRAWNNKQKSKAAKDDHAYMRFQCVKSFKDKYGYLKGAERKKYIKRMMGEIEIFELRNFSSYMLITSSFSFEVARTVFNILHSCLMELTISK